MPEKIIAGNWKMHMDHVEGEALAGELASRMKESRPGCKVVVMPPFTTLPAVVSAVAGSGISTGAQDLWYEDEGAFTGEVSGGMLASLGCSYVLVGHSERRHIMGEKAGILEKKLVAALRAGLKPVYCIGELLDERESGRAEEVVAGQVRDVLSNRSAEEMAGVVVAYEPVWAIGTGKTATPKDASGMHGVIREVLSGIFGPGVSKDTSILYGGSVKPENAGDLLGADDIDGALVGGASLDADSFFGIIEAL